VSDAVDRFTAAAAAMHLRAQVRRFPEGTKTAADAARAIECEVAQIVKSLVFTADGAAFLALTSGTNRADTRQLATLMGATEVRRATPEEARAATGFAVGGTPPFGHVERLRTLCDQDLLAHEVVWAAAGTPDSVFPLTPAELLRCSGAEVATFRESADG
jgi:prolyl-tRNA editing enzyme YbaK/EbsC (Cys-tRNA(Pro) deacylase)